MEIENEHPHLFKNSFKIYLIEGRTKLGAECVSVENTFDMFLIQIKTKIYH